MSLGHDFAHRARAAGWSLEEVAYYLGHITKSGMPAIQTTIRYTQVSREHVKEKLKLLTMSTASRERQPGGRAELSPIQQDEVDV
jgi:hypothetical protein